MARTAEKFVSARITYPGMGGFLNPPTHPEHHLHVETDLRRRKHNRGGMSLSYAASDEATWLDPAARAEAKRRLAAWDAPPADDPAIVDWRRQVLGYYRGMYRGTAPVEAGTEWNVSNLSHDPKRDPIAHADAHAGVHHIRKFYPEYMLTEEDLRWAYWGTKPVAVGVGVRKSDTDGGVDVAIHIALPNDEIVEAECTLLPCAEAPGWTSWGEPPHWLSQAGLDAAIAIEAKGDVAYADILQEIAAVAGDYARRNFQEDDDA